MGADKIKNVLIIGAGTMGQQITVPCVLNGYTVSVYDISEEVLDEAKSGIDKLLNFFVKNKGLSQEKAEGLFHTIKFTTDMKSAAADADIVSESVPEDPKLKGSIFSELNESCPQHTIFTTNTSTLLPSMFAQSTGRADRFAALHFHDVRISTIVDVMPHPETSKETIDAVRDFAVAIGQTPIVMERESPGYVFNFMLSNLFESAMTLAANGVASVEDIDRSWMGVTHMATGPFGIMDSVGLSTVWKITDFWAEKLNDPQKKRNAAFIKEYIDRGDLGVKTGKGFYSYPKPRFRDQDFIASG